jgi:transcriptional regulator with XRE-family HTH domain
VSDLAEKIKRLREQSGMSMRELAAKCDTSKSAIFLYEQGKRKPKYETLEALADVFNVDMAYLLGRQETPLMTEKPAPVDDITDEERALIDAFRALSPEDRALYLVLLKRGLGR